MNWKYHRDTEGGFIGSEDGQTQICDFRQGMGDIYGQRIADALNWHQGPPAPQNLTKLETSEVRWEYEDQLPEMDTVTFETLFDASRVDVVRLYPYVENSNGNRIWITRL